MIFYNSFPQTPVCRRVRALYAAPVLLLLAAVAAHGQSGQQRPVARLIATADHAPQVASARARTHLVDDEIGIAAPARARAVVSAAAAGASSEERRAFELINAARRQAGEPPLQWDAELQRMARQHSESMARQNFFGHAGPDGRDTEARARALGLRGWGALAENLAYNQGFDDPAGFAVERWLKSVKHRENVMRAGFNATGIGVARGADGRVYFTQVFAAR
ncbi:MAG TPA: CAP domain-containing protein [Pyrinomonadaceae bacterium]|jgi:uncharacterized protein YkwD